MESFELQLFVFETGDLETGFEDGVFGEVAPLVAGLETVVV